MARLVRGDLVDPNEIAAFHCISRTVRRSFLCGRDAVSGRDYEHRRNWIEQRIQFLAGQFGIDVLGFAVMSNHLHLVLRSRPDVVAQWSDEEAVRRWLLICPAHRNNDGSPAEPTAPELNARLNSPQWLQQIRARLSDISWFMRLTAEPIARRANREDNARVIFGKAGSNR